MAEWKIIDEFPEYEVSDDGRVRRPCGIWREFGNQVRYFEPGELKPQRHPGGYRYVSFVIDGRRETKKKVNRYIHRLVATAFVPNPEGKRDVNHKSGIKAENHAANLEWTTRSENMTHKTRVLGIGRGESNPGAKLTEEAVAIIRASSRRRMDLAEEYGVCRQTVDQIKSGKIWAPLPLRP